MDTVLGLSMLTYLPEPARMLEEAHVAATPGVDFDPIKGRHFIRFCYAGSADEMREAVERIGKWLGHQ